MDRDDNEEEEEEEEKDVDNLDYHGDFDNNEMLICGKEYVLRKYVQNELAWWFQMGKWFPF